MPSDATSARSDGTALTRAHIAFFCSRTCSGDIILKAQDWANARGPGSSPVIGGFHTPIERDVLRILLRGGAPIILVLARAMWGYRMPPAIKAAIAAGKASIVSPFPANQTRTTAATAEARNRHILTCCDSALFAHAAPGGKTEALAHEAIALGITALTFDSSHNRNLLDLGARLVDEVR